MTNHERRELIDAFHELTTFAERLLELDGKLLNGLTGSAPLSPEALAEIERGHEGWVQNLAEFRKRLAGLMIEPPSQLQ